MSRPQDPANHLPLRPVEFEILLVLLAGDRHGYAIIKEARERWPGKGSMETGTLYRALRRLTVAGMVEPADRRPASESGDERRRYFAITPFGRAEAQLEVARSRNLLPGAEGRGA
jgi:DNA-binding PadR family transcriptional regulator